MSWVLTGVEVLLGLSAAWALLIYVIDFSTITERAYSVEANKALALQFMVFVFALGFLGLAL